jgi:hypothetical protein
MGSLSVVIGKAQRPFLCTKPYATNHCDCLAQPDLFL